MERETELVNGNNSKPADVPKTFPSVVRIESDDINQESDEICPWVGKEFGTHEEAYVFYNHYAGCTGFSVRKNTTARSKINKEKIGQTFTCSLEGMTDYRAKSFDERTRTRDETRTGCKAMMTVRKKQNEDTWVVTKFFSEHNHDLVDSSKRHLLRSQRRIEETQKQSMHSAAVEFMPREAGGVENIGFTRKLANGDAQAVLDHLRQQQVENPTFYYSIQIDSEGRMTSLFWSDAKSRMDYHYFGDVVCFDPTYGMNKYNMPFIPIIGINHHHQTIIFGGAFLYSETEESFMWVMKSWMEAVDGKQPKVILTDQDSAIGGAIEKVLPGTRHRYCLWHINRNALKNLSYEINKCPDFYKEFKKCLYEYETIEEFECSWSAMVEEYNLKENMWLSNMFEKREKWASVYTRDVFCADMYTTQRSESINSYFDKYLKRGMPLFEFVQQYERAIMDGREAENNEDYTTNHSRPSLRYSMKVEKEASSVYTRVIFKKFQEQLFQGLSYRHQRVGGNDMVPVYNVWMEGYEDKKRTVRLEHSTKNVECSCRLFEFAGYLCRHILKIFVVEDVQVVPEKYILKRWTKTAKFGSMVLQKNSQQSVSMKFAKLCQEGVNIASKASTSDVVYTLAMRGLQNLLQDVEAAMKNLSLESEENGETSAHLEKNQISPKGRPRLDKGGKKRRNNTSEKTTPLKKTSAQTSDQTHQFKQTSLVTRPHQTQSGVNNVIMPYLINGNNFISQQIQTNIVDDHNNFFQVV